MDLERLEKKSEKASARTERVRAKMPKEKRYKIERSFDDTTGQVKKRLVIEQRDKIVKDSFIKKQGRMITGTASNKIHSKIAQVEHENTAVEAAHRTEQQAEDVLRYINRKKRSKYQRELKKLEKAQKKELKANTKYQYEKFKKENPQYDRNIMKKHLQKRRIRKEYKARMRQQAVRSVNTLAASLKEMLMKKKGIMIGTAIGALLFMMIASSLGSCGVMMSGGGSGTVAGSYLSEPTEIDKADNSFSEKEIALQNTINHIEREHPGFDEYRYNLGPIGHSPFELVNYLSAKNISFTYDDIQPQIQSVFDEMYQLHLRHVRERRTRTETRTGHRTIHHQDGSTTSESYEYEVEVEYYVDILETTLTVKELSAIANENLTTDQKQLYEVYETTHGGLQQF